MVERSIKVIISAVAVSMAIKSLPHLSAANRKSVENVVFTRKLTAAVSDTAYRCVWNAAYAIWQALLLGRGSQPSRN